MQLWMILQAGWRENQATFMNELKNLQATGLSTLGTSLKEAFDLLNLYRLHSGIDNYGMVRFITLKVAFNIAVTLIVGINKCSSWITPNFL